MKTTLKKINNGWLIKFTSEIKRKVGAYFPIEHFEPTLDKAVAFITKTSSSVRD